MCKPSFIAITCTFNCAIRDKFLKHYTLTLVLSLRLYVIVYKKLNAKSGLNLGHVIKALEKICVILKSLFNYNVYDCKILPMDVGVHSTLKLPSAWDMIRAGILLPLGAEKGHYKLKEFKEKGGPKS